MDIPKQPTIPKMPEKSDDIINHSLKEIRLFMDDGSVHMIDQIDSYTIDVNRNDSTMIDFSIINGRLDFDEEDCRKMANNKLYRLLGKAGELRTIKPCPYLLPCGSCDKRNGELCSQYK